MNAKLLCTLAVVSLAMLACDKDKPAGETTASKTEPAAADKPAADKPAADKPAADKPAADKPAADVACDAVVAKLAGFNPGSGEPEKKLWTKMCDGMPQGVRACIVAAGTLEDSQKCMTDKKIE